MILIGFSLSSYQGYVQAALVLGGVDCTGPHLHTVSFLLLAELSSDDDSLYYLTNILGKILMAMVNFADISTWFN